MKRIKRFLGQIGAVCLTAVLICTPMAALLPETAYAATGSYATELAKFPASYQTKLKELHTKHPNWIFVADYTNRDWSEALAGENKSTTSTIQQQSTAEMLLSKQPGDYANGKYTTRDAGGWVSCNEAAVAYYLDPRNFLDEENVMMFESAKFDAGSQTQAGVAEIIKNTFMDKPNIPYLDAKGIKKTINKTYAQVIYEAGKAAGVNPYFLASKIINEVGTGGSKSVTGDYTVKGYYNFFNIGATDGGDPITKGLNYAKTQGWNTPEKSITGGAVWIYKHYVADNQDTPYYQRFNVSATAKYPYRYQYATCVFYAASTASATFNAYKNAGTLENTKIFKIPVFDNMPGISSQTSSFRMKTTPTSQKGTTTSSVSLRNGASASATFVTSIPSGASVTISQKVRTTSNRFSYFNKNPYWYKVSYNGYTGYVAGSYVKISETLNVTVGETQTAAVASGSGDVIYFSDNNSIATIDQKGTVTGKKKGTTRVFALSSGGGFDFVNVTVNAAAVSDKMYASSKPGAVNAAGVNLREGPSTSSKILKVLSKGTAVTVLGENGSFYKTDLGYLSKTYVNTYSGSVYAASKKGTTKTAVNLRTGPSTSYSLVKRLPKNTALTVLGESGSFYRTTIGYVSKTYVKLKSEQGTTPPTTPSTPETSQTGYGIVTADELNVRSGATTASAIVSNLTRGTAVQVLGSVGDFYKIKTGYVSKQYVKLYNNTVYAASKTGKATAAVNIRTGPGTGYALAGLTKKGQSLTVLGENSSYYLTSIGYVSKKYVTFSTGSGSSSTTTTSKFGKTTGKVNVRASASTSSKIVKVLKKGSYVTISGTSGNFYKLSDGTYASKTYVSPLKETTYSTAKSGVLVSATNLRKGPSTAYSVQKVLSGGTKLSLLGECNGFYKTKDGYVVKSQIKASTLPEDTTIEGDALYDTPVKGYVIHVSYLNLREQPNTSCKVLKKYYTLDRVTIIGDNGGFYKTKDGYLSQDYVLIEETGDKLYTKDKIGVVVGKSSVKATIMPNSSSSSTHVFQPGAKVYLYGINGKFYRTNVGYLPAGSVVIANSGDSIYSASKTGTVTGTSLNIRQTASTKAKIVGSYKMGTKVTLLGTNGSFYKVSGGYIHKDYVSIAGAASGNGDKLYTTAKTGKVSSSGARLNVRKTASANGAILGYVSDGATLRLLGENGNFYKISSGYVMKKYVKVTSSGSSTSSSIKVSNTVKANGGLNIRQSPSTSAKKVGSYANGATVKIKAVSGSWYKTDKGWISGSYVVSKTATVKWKVNVRLTGSTSAKIVKTLPAGKKVKVLATSGDWVLTDQGGWIKKNNLKQ